MLHIIFLYTIIMYIIIVFMEAVTLLFKLIILIKTFVLNLFTDSRMFVFYIIYHFSIDFY